MENMVDFSSLFGGIYNGKKVLVTGHTGFKGSWLAYWLQKMGAKVYGYSLEAPSELNHIAMLQLDIEEKIADLRDASILSEFIEEIQPDIVFHLAAQALVRASYTDPVETFSTNVMGTINLLEACRNTKSIQAIVNVTTDKCYENKEWIWGYRENEAMGGYDPYSASKGCSELVSASYRNSFFHLDQYGSSHSVLLATARAGNVIGGGDWAEDRLIPDMVKMASLNQIVRIRNPKSTRPWQHVLEPLSGYLNLGWKLLEGKKSFAEAWNFGPETSSNLAVEEIVNLAIDNWSNIKVEYSKDINDHHEANLLMLDCTKANKIMRWKAVWDIEDTIQKTIQWYKQYYVEGEINTEKDLCDYVFDAKQKEMLWVK